MTFPLKYSLFGLVSSIALLSPASAQTQSSTPVIGYYKFDVPAGTSAWSAGLVTKKDFQGAATSMTPGPLKSTITVTGATWTPAAFNLHYVEILSGPMAGLVMDIDTAVPNTATQLTVLGNTGSPSGFGLTGTETFCIRKHVTLGSLFKNGAGLNAFADTVTLINSDGSEVVAAFDGTNWVDAGDFVTDRNTDIIYPGQGFLITSSGPGLVTFGGDEVSYVKTGPTKISVYGGKLNLVGVLSPLVATSISDPLYSTAKQTLNGLNLSTFLAPFADVVGTYSNDGLLNDGSSYGFDGSVIVDGADFTTPKGTDVLRNGSAFTLTTGADTIYTLPELIPATP